LQQQQQHNPVSGGPELSLQHTLQQQQQHSPAAAHTLQTAVQQLLLKLQLHCTIMHKLALALPTIQREQTTGLLTICIQTTGVQPGVTKLQLSTQLN
jgi:hypothetical protein